MQAEQRAPGLAEQLREDLSTHGGAWTRPGFQAVAVHRVGAWARTQPRRRRAPLVVLARVLDQLVRILYGIELPAEVKVGRRLRIAHQGGVVVNGAAVIGDDCLLRHNVTIGAASEERMAEAPVLGDGVRVGPGAVIMGPVTVGDGVLIGPNAVVVADVPPGARVLAPPAEIRPSRTGGPAAGR